MTIETARRAEATDETIRAEDDTAIRDCLLDYYALLVRTTDGWRITGTVWRWAEGHGPRAA